MQKFEFGTSDPRRFTQQGHIGLEAVFRYEKLGTLHVALFVRIGHNEQIAGEFGVAPLQGSSRIDHRRPSCDIGLRAIDADHCINAEVSQTGKRLFGPRLAAAINSIGDMQQIAK